MRPYGFWTSTTSDPVVDEKNWLGSLCARCRCDLLDGIAATAGGQLLDSEALAQNLNVSVRTLHSAACAMHG